MYSVQSMALNQIKGRLQENELLIRLSLSRKKNSLQHAYEASDE